MKLITNGDEVKRELKAGMARLYAAVARNGRSKSEDEYLQRSAGGLSLGFLATTIADAVRSREKVMLRHVGRLYRLLSRRLDSLDSDVRFRNLHRRLTEAES